MMQGLRVPLLLTDVGTPLMRGGQLAQEFRVIHPGVKVLFMSTYNMSAYNSPPG